MQLSRNFYLQELVRSQTATRYGIPNHPNTKQIANLKSLCQNVLQPVRDYFKKPVIVSSGYRSPLLNARIGGSNTSQHCLGLAADFEIPGVANKSVAEWIKNNLEYDQLILEFWNEKNPNSGWIHCSYVNSNRQQSLVYNGKKYRSWV